VAWAFQVASRRSAAYFAHGGGVSGTVILPQPLRTLKEMRHCQHGRAEALTTNQPIRARAREAFWSP
jgi:hypothetical protein